MAKITDVTSNVEFHPYVVRGYHGAPLEEKSPCKLNKYHSELLIKFLRTSRWGHALENEFDLQGICKHENGTRYLSAMMPPYSFIELLKEAGAEFETYVSRAKEWVESFGCNEVIVHFVDARCLAKNSLLIT